MGRMLAAGERLQNGEQLVSCLYIGPCGSQMGLRTFFRLHVPEQCHMPISLPSYPSSPLSL